MLWNVLERILHWTLRIATFSTVEIINEGGMLELAGSEPLVLAANHQSHTDTSILFHAVPNSRREQMRIVASEIRFRPAELNASWRERLERWFMHGVAVHVYSAIFVGGEVGRIRSIDVITQAIEEGSTVVVYPEGTRSSDGALGALRPGVALTAIHTGCKVIPVRIDGTGKALPRSRYLPRFRSRVTVRFRAPLVAFRQEEPNAFLHRLTKQLLPNSSTQNRMPQ